MSRRIRDLWRPWNWSSRRWALTWCVCIIASPFVTRWIFLWQIPDVSLTFDVEEFLAAENGSDEEDAGVHYVEAQRLMGIAGGKWGSRPDDSKALEKAQFAILRDRDTPWDPLLGEWLDANRPALAEYRRGGEKPFMKGPSLRTADSTLILSPHNEFRHFARLAALEAIRCESRGDLQTALQWHRATLLAGRHAETPRLEICRFVATAVRSVAIIGIVHWSQHSSLTRDQLEQAKAMVKLEFSRRFPASEFSKGEYLMVRNTAQRPDADVYFLPPAVNKGVLGHPSVDLFKRFGVWLYGQPECLLRAQRQLLLNNRDNIDLPVYSRRSTIDCKKAIVFEADPENARSWTQLSPRKLASRLDESIFHIDLSFPSVSTKQLDNAIQRENARVAALDVVLAAQQFHRDFGEFPQNLEQLVPGYMTAIPFDPTSPKAIPLKYRRESPDSAVVWSIGLDGQDDGGDVQNPVSADKDEGYRFRFGRKAKDETSRTVSDGEASK